MAEDATASLIGRQLGSYRIRSLLGAGGMGEVYRAIDTKLGREVAIKILPSSFADEPERVRRFEREARILAALNHPHVGAIYGLEDFEGVAALVLELVEGPTLADRVAVGPIRAQEALAIAGQIAEALEAAHEKGIIHRDLKPANIKVAQDGRVKVLDFGLAKAFAVDPLESELSELPTATAAGTRKGVILGTTAYMSPEQARGQATDRRTDVWAFGCVLYEMLTGRAAFGQETVSDTIVAILEREPDWTALPASTLPGIDRLLRRCLQKDPRSRLRDIADAGIELREAIPERPASSLPPGAGRRRQVLPWAAAAFLALAAGILGWRLGDRIRQSTISPEPIRFSVELPAAAPLFDRGRGNRFIALSPDGTHLAFFAQALGEETAQLWLRPLAQLESRLILTTSDRGYDPFFSPDGRWIGFFDGRKVKKVSIAGGEPLTVCDLPAGYSLGASWGADDTIFFTPSRGAGLWRVPAAGGVPSVVWKDDDSEYRLPQVLPNGKAILFTSSSSADAGRYVGRATRMGPDPQIYVQSLETGERRAVIQGVGAYFANGYLVFGRGNSLLAVPFDLERLEAVGTPLPLIDRVYAETAPQISVSNGGSLACIPTLGRADGTLTWVDRDGADQPVPAPARPYLQPRLAPDGRRLAVLIEPIQGSASASVWTYDFARGALTAVTPDARSGFPVWTPDGARLTFSSSGIYWRASDGSGPAERLFEDGLPLSWSPDGRTLAFVRVDEATQQDIWMLPVDGQGKPGEPYPFVQTRFAEGGPKFSPDGRFVAYVSSETGRNEVYVRPFTELEGRWQISTDGGNEIAWPREGHELFYRSGHALMAVDVTTTPAFLAERPRRVFGDSYVPTSSLWSNYDVTADGRRFLMIEPIRPSQARPQVINVVLNWPVELRRQVGQKK